MSMSCSPPASAPALDLLDECWFFSNTLVNKPPRSPSTSTSGDADRIMSNKGSGSGSGSEGPSRFYAASVTVSWGRKLLRTPSLPSPRRVVVQEEEVEVEEDRALLLVDTNNSQQQQEKLVVDQDQDQQQHQHQHQDEVDDDDLNWSSIYEGVLRTRMAGEGGSRRSALQRAPSMPIVSSSSSSTTDTDTDHQVQDDIKSTPSISMPRLRHSYSTLERHHTAANHNQQQQQQQQQQRGAPGLVRSNSNLKTACFLDNNKWKSSSHLESIEVQGFRDLGFVFDKEELRESLADVLPGLKQQQQQQAQRHNKQSGAAVRRPYLSEAWQQRPALVRVQSSSAAAEMKDQLRLWAQSVACNVRHEC